MTFIPNKNQGIPVNKGFIPTKEQGIPVKNTLTPNKPISTDNLIGEGVTKRAISPYQGIEDKIIGNIVFGQDEKLREKRTSATLREGSPNTAIVGSLIKGRYGYVNPQDLDEYQQADLQTYVANNYKTLENILTSIPDSPTTTLYEGVGGKKQQLEEARNRYFGDLLPEKTALTNQLKSYQKDLYALHHTYSEYIDANNFLDPEDFEEFKEISGLTSVQKKDFIERGKYLTTKINQTKQQLESIYKQQKDVQSLFSNLAIQSDDITTSIINNPVNENKKSDLDILYDIAKNNSDHTTIWNPELNKGVLYSFNEAKTENGYDLKSILNKELNKNMLPHNPIRGREGDLNIFNEIKSQDEAEKEDFKKLFKIDPTSLQKNTYEGLKQYIDITESALKGKNKNILYLKSLLKNPKIDSTKVQEEINKINEEVKETTLFKDRLLSIGKKYFKQYKDWDEFTEKTDIEYDIDNLDWNGIKFTKDIIKPITTEAFVRPIISTTESINSLINQFNPLVSKSEQVADELYRTNTVKHLKDLYVPETIKNSKIVELGYNKDGSFSYEKSVLNPRILVREGIKTTAQSLALVYGGQAIGTITGLEAFLGREGAGVASKYFADKVGIIPASNMFLWQEIREQNIEDYLQGNLSSINDVFFNTFAQTSVEGGTEMLFVPEAKLLKSFTKNPIQEIALNQLFKKSIGKEVLSPQFKLLIKNIGENFIKTPLEESFEEVAGNLGNDILQNYNYKTNTLYNKEDNFTAKNNIETIIQTSLSMLPTMIFGFGKTSLHNHSNHHEQFALMDIGQHAEMYNEYAENFIRNTSNAKLKKIIPGFLNKESLLNQVKETNATLNKAYKDAYPTLSELITDKEKLEYFNTQLAYNELSSFDVTPFSPEQIEKNVEKLSILGKKLKEYDNKVIQAQQDFKKTPVSTLAKILPKLISTMDIQSDNIPTLQAIQNQISLYQDILKDNKDYSKHLEILKNLQENLNIKIESLNDLVDKVETTPEIFQEELDKTTLILEKPEEQKEDSLNENINLNYNEQINNLNLDNLDTFKSIKTNILRDDTLENEDKFKLISQLSEKESSLREEKEVLEKQKLIEESQKPINFGDKTLNKTNFVKYKDKFYKVLGLNNNNTLKVTTIGNNRIEINISDPRDIEQVLTEEEALPIIRGEKPKEVKSEIEAIKADIERRRQEALFGNITPLEFETTDTKGRTRKTTVKTKIDENGFKYSFETTVDGKSSSAAHPKVTKQEFKNSSIYKNLDQDSKDFIDELPEDAVILLQSVAISTDKNSAAGLGNGNITIGYVSKEEGGRADDIALKYQPNKINAKYDAELKALEQSTSTTQSEIEGKKTDVELDALKQAEQKLLSEVDNLSEDITELEVIGSAIEGLFKIENTNPHIDGYNPEIFEDYMKNEFNNYVTLKKIKEIITKYKDFFEHAFSVHKLAWLSEKGGKSGLSNNSARLNKDETNTKAEPDASEQPVISQEIITTPNLEAIEKIVEKTTKERIKEILRLQKNFNPFGSAYMFWRPEEYETPMVKANINTLEKLRQSIIQGNNLNQSDIYVSVQKNTIPPKYRREYINSKTKQPLTEEQITKGIVTVLTNSKGEYLYFTENGDLTSNPEEGYIVYNHFMSNVTDAKTLPSPEELKEFGLESSYKEQVEQVKALRKFLDKNPTDKFTFEIKEITSAVEKTKEVTVYNTDPTSTDYAVIQTNALAGQINVKLPNQNNLVVSAPLPSIKFTNLKETLERALDDTSYEGLPEDWTWWQKYTNIFEAYVYTSLRDQKNKPDSSSKEITSEDMRRFRNSLVLTTKADLPLEDLIKNNILETFQLNINYKFLDQPSVKRFLWSSEQNKWVQSPLSYEGIILDNVQFKPFATETRDALIKLGPRINKETPITTTETVEPIKEIPKEKPVEGKLEGTILKKRERKIFQNPEGPTLFDISESLERSKTYKQLNITKAQEQKAKKWFDKYLKTSGVKFEDLLHIVNNTAFATWQNAIIKLFYGANSADLYHESFHDFTQMFLTKKQKIALYEEVMQTPEGKKAIKGKEPKLEQYHAIEELLAEDFRNYMLSGQKLILNQRPKRNTIFRKIYNFLKGLLTNQPSLEEIYKNLATHNFSKYKRSEDNIMFGKLNSSKLPLSLQETIQLNKAIDSLIAKAFRVTKNPISKMFKDSSYLTASYNSVYTELNNTYESFLEEYNNLLNTSNPNQLELEQLDDNISKLEFILEKNNWNIIKLNHAQNSNLLKLSEEFKELSEESFDEEENIQSKESSLYDVDDTQSVKSKASAQLIYLIATLPDYVNQKPIYNKYLTFVQDTVEFNNAWNKIADILKGERDYPTQYSYLQQKAEQDKMFTALVESIPNPQEELNSLSSQLRNQFSIMFSQPLIPMFYSKFTFNSEGKLNVKSREATSNSEAKIKSDWVLNLQSSKNEYNTLNQYGRRELNLDRILYDFVNISKLSKTRKIEFLKALGIKLSPITIDSQDFIDFLEDPNNLKKVYNYISEINEIREGKNKEANAQEIQESAQPIYDITKLIGRDFVINGKKAIISLNNSIIKKLIEIELKNGDKYFSDNRMNSEGNSTYGIRPWNQQSIIYSIINDVSKYPTYQDLLTSPLGAIFNIETNPDANNLYLQTAFDLKTGKRRTTNGKPVLIKLFDQNGLDISTTENNEAKGVKTMSLSRFMKAIQDISSLLTTGHKEHLRYGDKTTSNGTLTTYPRQFATASQNFLPEDIKSFENSYVPTEAFEIYKNRLSVTLQRTNDYFIKNTLKDNDTFSKAMQSKDYFGIFDGLLSKKTKDKIISEGLTEKYLNAKEIVEKYSKDIKEDIAKYNKNMVEDYKKELQSNNTLTPENYIDNYLLQQYSFDTIIRAYTINSYIMNMEHIALMFQDIRFYVNKGNTFKGPFKRFSKSTSTGILSTNDKQVNDLIEKLSNLETEEYNKKYSTNIPFRPTQNNKKIAIFNDPTLKGIESTKEFLKELDEIFKNETLENKLAIAEAYNNAEIANAMGMCTFSYYREFRIKSGNDNWGPESERLYTKIIKNEPLTEEELKSSFLFFPPLKLRVTGFSKNSEGLIIPVDLKFAVSPLIPSIIKGKNYDTVRDKMIKQGISIAAFSSASKHSASINPSTGKYNNLYQEEDYITDEVYQDFIYEVVPSPIEYKEEVTFSTQLRKLLFVNSYNNGIPVDYKNSKDWFSLTEKEKLASSKLYTLDSNFTNAIESLVDIEKNKLLKQIGATLTEDGRSYTLDQSKFSILLEKEIKTRELPLSTLESIKLVNNKFKYKLDSSLQRETLEQILLSIIDNRLRKQKGLGEALIQASSVGYEDNNNNNNENSNIKPGAAELFESNPELANQVYEALGFKQNKIDLKPYALDVWGKVPNQKRVDTWNNTGGTDLPYYKYQNRTLPDGTKVTSAQKVKIALQGDFKKLLNLKDVKNLANNPEVIKEAKEKGGTHIPELVALNRLIKNEKWLDKNNLRDLITLTGVRIPVQGHNSMEFMEVYEFLPEEAGPIIIVSPALVAKSGGDFDWDKITTLFTSFDNDFKPFNSKDLDVNDNYKEDLEKIFKEKDDYLQIKNDLKKSLDLYSQDKDFSKLAKQDLKYNLRLLNIEIDLKNQTLTLLEDIYTDIKNLEGLSDNSLITLNTILGETTEYTRSELILSAIESKIKEIESKIEEYDRIKKILIPIIDSAISQSFEDINYTKTSLKHLYEKLNNNYENINDIIRKNAYKKAYNNEINKIIRQVLERSENIEQLLTPNSTHIFEPTADARKSATSNKIPSWSDVANPIESLNQHESNGVGKKGLGILAVANTFFSQLQKAGAYLNKTFKKGSKSRPVNHRLQHNTTKEGNISISSINDKSGKYKISEIISQLMNGAVDVAKKDWLFYINGVLEVVPTFTYLTFTGTPPMESVAFLNQPSIYEYTKALRNYKSLLVKTLFPDKYKNAKIYAAYNVLKSLLSNNNLQKTNKLIKNKKLLNDVDTERFNKYLEKSKNALPNKFFTESSTFKEFYNNNLGKRGKIPDKANWFLDLNTQLYNLIDQETGEILIEHVDLKSGFQYIEEGQSENSLISPSTLSNQILNFLENSLEQLIIEDKPFKFYTLLYDILPKIANQNTDVFDFDYMKDFSIPNKDTGKIKTPSTIEEKLAQIYYLTQFIEFDDQQSTLSSIRTTYNQDTNKPKNIQESKERLIKRSQLANLEILPQKVLDRLAENTTTKAFTSSSKGIDNFINKISKSLFEITNNPLFNKFLFDEFNKSEKSAITPEGSLIKEGNNIPFNIRMEIKEKWVKTVKNDFIEYLVKNNLYILKDNKPVEKVQNYFFKNLISYENGLYKTLDYLKDEYPDLVANNILLQNLVTDPSYEKERGVPKVMSIKLKKERLEPSIVDAMQEGFKDLMYFSDPSYTTEEQVFIQNFAQDLAYLAFNQSGFNQSNISITKILPPEFIQSQISEIITAFEEVMEKTPERAIEEFNNFYKLFKLNNRQFFSNEYILDEEKGYDVPRLDFRPYDLTKRGKNYASYKALDLLGHKENFNILEKERELQKIKDKISIAQEPFTENTAKDNPQNLYVFEANQNNDNKYGSMIVKESPKQNRSNTLPIITHSSFNKELEDKDFVKNKTLIDTQIDQIVTYIKQNNPTKVIFSPEFAERLKNSPETFKYLSEKLQDNFGLSLNLPIFEEENNNENMSGSKQLNLFNVENNIQNVEQIYSQLGNKTKSENVVIDEVAGRKPVVETNKIYTYEDFAKDNEGVEVLVQYDKYKTPFKAIITGKTEEVSSGSDDKGTYKYVGVQVMSTTGKFLTVNPFSEITGNIKNQDKLTNNSNLIRNSEKQANQISTKENPIIVYVDGSDIKGTGAIGFGVNTTKNNQEYSISGAFDTKDLSKLEKDLGITLDTNPSNAVMEFYGSLIALRNTPENEFITIKQDLEGVQLWILSGLMEKLSKQNLDTKKKYDNWYKSLSEEQKQDYYNRIQNVISLDKSLISKFDWDGRKGYYAEDKTVRAIQQKLIDIILDRKGKIQYQWVKGHSGETGNEKVDTIAKDRNNYNTYKDLFQQVNKQNNVQNQSSKPIVAYGTRGNNFLEALEKDNAIGNPWSHLGSGQNENLTKKNLFTVKPIQAVDKKAVIKASIATQYIGFGEGIEGSSTESYRQQVLEQSKNNIEISTQKYTRQSVEDDSNTMYLFTDNAERTSSPNANSENVDKNTWYYKKYKSKTNKPIHFGSLNNPTSAVIRGLNNAYPISTMSAYGTNWTDDNFELFKQTIDDEINQIKQDLPKFSKLKIGNYRIGQGGLKAKLPLQHQNYLDNKLKEIGIDNTQPEPKIINQSNIVNSGNYSSNDVIFVSVGGKRGNEIVRKQQQDRTIKEALKAIEAGATLITDNKSYVESSDYNEGEKRLAKNLESKGYSYSEQTIDGQLLGVWTKNQYGLYKTNTVKEAVEEFIAWMIGEKHTDKLQDYRQAIIDRIPELKNTKILTDNDNLEFANTLDYLIQNWDNIKNQSNNNLSNNNTKNQKFSEEDLKMIKSFEFKEYFSNLPQDMQDIFDTNPQQIIKHFKENKC